MTHNFAAGAPKASTTRSFLRRLREDKTGNTLAIVAAAMIPMTGMIGCGVDISRAYYAKTQGDDVVGR